MPRVRMHPLLVCIPILAAACATAPSPTSDPPVLGAEFVSVGDLASRHRLSTSYEQERNRLVLSGPEGVVLLYPGTTVATVNGRRVPGMSRISAQDGLWAISATDASRLEQLLRTVPPPAEPFVPPARTASPPEPPSAMPPPSLAAPKTWRVPLKRKWEYLVIHHSGTRSGSAESFHQDHTRARGWAGLGYHFVIGNGQGAADGLVEVGYRWTRQLTGAHAGKAVNGSNRMNETGIGICLVGDFDVHAPTPAQLESLRLLLGFLKDYCGLAPDRVLLHRDVRDTKCPGRRFPTREFVQPRRSVPGDFARQT